MPVFEQLQIFCSPIHPPVPNLQWKLTKWKATAFLCVFISLSALLEWCVAARGDPNDADYNVYKEWGTFEEKLNKWGYCYGEEHNDKNIPRAALKMYI